MVATSTQIVEAAAMIYFMKKGISSFGSAPFFTTNSATYHLEALDTFGHFDEAVMHKAKESMFDTQMDEKGRHPSKRSAQDSRNAKIVVPILQHMCKI